MQVHTKLRLPWHICPLHQYMYDILTALVFEIFNESYWNMYYINHSGIQASALCALVFHVTHSLIRHEYV